MAKPLLSCIIKRNDFRFLCRLNRYQYAHTAPHFFGNINRVEFTRSDWQCKPCRQFVTIPPGFNDKAVEIIMLWFKNLMVYRLSRDITLRAEEMEKQLASMTFYPMR
ncbi:recombination associated protein [Salmonella enterica subsp. enterica]|uniref:Recombination associated protein n=1 Tax=Salmonella enterica I TaxID=59201 RepID=A0A447U952_SALET|nr:recombination associated protein [Salmonella enterica subsp. enterica]